MGGGDWNDGMNRVGHLGRGESVWLGFFLHAVLTQFAALASERGDAAFAARCREGAAALVGPIEEHGWDGQWYRRAYFDDGEPLGSAENVECQIDSLSQSWATIAGVGAPARREQALDSLWDRLVRQDLQIVPLLVPPFDQSTADPGYIKGYPPGVRENGGQYSHAAVWAVWALALAGRSEQAATLVSYINPINHALDPAAVTRYGVEPYVLAADVYTCPPHEGRGGWTWYTGSAAWLYRLLHEVIFGVVREGDALRFEPRVSPAWEQFTLHYRYYETFYHMVFTQSSAHRGPSRVTLDGRELPDGRLRLIDDRTAHAVEVFFGPAASRSDQAPAPAAGDRHPPSRPKTEPGRPGRPGREGREGRAGVPVVAVAAARTEAGIPIS
jgi:cyclic beta-1,2-glucan synthetase